MDPRDAELLAKLLPTFRLEAEDHLRRMETLLGSLQDEPSAAAVQEIFREVHSLKGAARAVNARELETLCQEMESLFAAATKGALRLERQTLDLLYVAADLASDLTREAGRKPTPELSALAEETGRRLADAARGNRVEPPHPPPRPETEPPEPIPRPSADTLRIGAEKIEGILLQAEELLGDKLSARAQKEALGELLRILALTRKGLAMAASEARVLQRALEEGGGNPLGPTERTRSIPRLLGILTEGDEGVKTAEESVRRLQTDAEEHFRSLAGKVDLLLETVRDTLMLPVGTLLDSFPRLVRELARESGKGIELETAGGETPVDRRILEEIRDPLQHLLRNAVDHGIEPPPERTRRGKPERGRIRLEVASPSPRRVLFTLSDDGRGFDLEKIKKAAIREGHLGRDEVDALDPWEIATLAFTSGLSTVEEVTTVSGRGLGLPIVRDKVERLGGTVHVASREAQGTTFRLEIPAALSAFRGVLTRIGARRYIFPVLDVERTLRVSPERFSLVENRSIFELDGHPLPVIRLEVPLGLPEPPPGDGPASLVLVHSKQGKVAFAVDEIVSEQEFLVKGLGKQLIKVDGLSGAAILGDGGIVFILDAEDLVRRASGPAVSVRPREEKVAASERKRILVAEDSITARTLLRNILESAGYAVTTAVDGVEALQKLSSAVYDIVVSDVEMPRMDGFALTRRIRETYGRLPVVLVTGLAGPEDREKGMDAGADAYIVKSRFDQGNLLEVVGRLI